MKEVGFRTLVLMLLWLLSTNLPAQNLEDLKGQTPVKLTSGLSLSTSFYSMKGAENRQLPYNWFLSGTPTLHLYGISIPVSFYWSNQSLGFQQPFNQIGISPTWKWIKLHAGYSSVNFSDYTLAGRRFLGGGVELNPGKLRIGVVYGRFQQAVEQDSIIRPTPGNFMSDLPNGAFSRKGYSIKLGFGSEKSFVDFILFHASDDMSSLTDSISLSVLTPESNTALGIKHRFSIGKKIFWESDLAGSLYTRDQNYPYINAASDVLPDFLHSLFAPRHSSQLLFAGNTQLGYGAKNWQTSLRYRRISRDFKTMGAYYFQTDVEEYSGQLSLHLFKRKVMLRGSLGFQRDNLSGDRQQTTNRIIGSGVAGWQITRQFRVDATYTNFGIQQRNFVTGLQDSVRIDQISSSIQLQMRYQFPDQLKPQSIGLSFANQSLAPRSRDLQFSVDTRSYQMNSFYIRSFPQQKIGISANIHGFWHLMNDNNTSSVGAGISSVKSDKSGKYSVQLGTQLYANRFRGESNGNTWTVRGGGNVQLAKNWNLTLQIQHLKTVGSLNSNAGKFNETMAQINTNFNF